MLKIIAADWPEDMSIDAIGKSVGLSEKELACLGSETIKSLARG